MSVVVGEGLACRLLQLTPAQFLSPVLLEAPHFTPVETDREIVVLRCDNGRKWTPHTNCEDTAALTSFLSSSFNNLVDKRSEVYL